MPYNIGVANMSRTWCSTCLWSDSHVCTTLNRTNQSALTCAIRLPHAYFTGIAHAFRYLSPH